MPSHGPRSTLWIILWVIALTGAHVPSDVLRAGERRLTYRTFVVASHDSEEGWFGNVTGGGDDTFVVVESEQVVLSSLAH